MVLARDSVFRSGYIPGVFSFVVIILTIMLYCSFRSAGLLSFYVFWSRSILTFLGGGAGGINLRVFRVLFINCFLLCWLLFLCWLVYSLFIVLWVLCGCFYCVVMMYWLVVYFMFVWFLPLLVKSTEHTLLPAQIHILTHVKRNIPQLYT